MACESWDWFINDTADDFAATSLRTFDFHGVMIGALICNDLWAHPQYTGEDDPHLLQKLSLMGAQVVLHAVNSNCDDTPVIRRLARNYHESNLCLRTAAANIPLVTVNNAAYPDVPLSSPSGVINREGKWLLCISDIGNIRKAIRFSCEALISADHENMMRK